MKDSKKLRLTTGTKVLLLGIPRGFLNDLPIEDQRAIKAAIKRPMEFIAYDSDGRAELEFNDSAGVFHTIYVDHAYVRRLKASDS